MLGYSLQKFIHYMAIATFVIADCRRISYLSNKAGAKTGGFRFSTFRQWISWISTFSNTLFLRWISSLAAKYDGFRLLGSGFREFEWISWISIIRQTGDERTATSVYQRAQHRFRYFIFLFIYSMVRSNTEFYWLTHVKNEHTSSRINFTYYTTDIYAEMTSHDNNNNKSWTLWAVV